MTAVQEIDLGGVSSAEFVLLETDNTIKVGVDNQTALLTVGKAFMVAGSSFSHLYVQNESTSVEATVQAVVVD